MKYAKQKRRQIILLVLLMSVGISVSFSQSSENQITDHLKKTLNKQYGKWQYAESIYFKPDDPVAHVGRKKGRNIVSGDFNTDGKTDYFIFIESPKIKKETRSSCIIAAWLNSSEGYKQISKGKNYSYSNELFYYSVTVKDYRLGTYTFKNEGELPFFQEVVFDIKIGQLRE